MEILLIIAMIFAITIVNNDDDDRNNRFIQRDNLNAIHIIIRYINYCNFVLITVNEN